MTESYLKQLGNVIRHGENTDGVLIANKRGIVEYYRVPINDIWSGQDIIGRHILELYPDLTEETSTVLQALRTGLPSYGQRQELTNTMGEHGILESDTIPIVVNGHVECVVDFSRLYALNRHIFRSDPESKLTALDRIITQDSAMQALKRRICDVAPLDSPVMICGETGTGKELVAEALHSGGGRADKPFVTQNCAAIPSNLLESIFFGTERGSYTGAVDRKGLLELADGGTLFLDEINSMDMVLQAKLLKVLEEKKVRRVGGLRDIAFNVRILSATNEAPLQAVREKRMREDLYYRLSVIRITIPPLRERAGDIPLLINYFIGKYNKALKRSLCGVSELTEQILTQYSWPGNVRELQNTIEGAFASAHSEQLVVDDIDDIFHFEKRVKKCESPFDARGESYCSLAQEMDDYERHLIVQAMQGSPSISETSRRLGISRQNLKYKLKKFGL